jgi:hypothetical protein
VLCFPWSHEHPSSSCAHDVDSRLSILVSPEKSILVFSDPPTPHSPFTRPPPPSAMLLPPPHTPLHPPVPLPPLCIARGCGVWWRADVCVPLCVSCEQYGDTPLLRACANGQRDIALRLVHHGANPLIKANNVSPPLCSLASPAVCVWGAGGVGACVRGTCLWAGPSGDAGLDFGEMCFLRFSPLFETRQN